MRSIIIGALAWLVLGTAGGFVVLAWRGEYGSVAQPLIGVTMGSLGAMTHGVLSAFARYRALSLLRRALVNWMCGFLVFLVYVAGLTNFGNAKFNPSFWPELMRFAVLYTGCPMFGIAVLVAALSGSSKPPSG